MEKHISETPVKLKVDHERTNKGNEVYDNRVRGAADARKAKKYNKKIRSTMGYAGYPLEDAK